MPFEVFEVEAARATCENCGDYDEITEYECLFIDDAEDVCERINYIYSKEKGRIFCCQGCEDEWKKKRQVKIEYPKFV